MKIEVNLDVFRKAVAAANSAVAKKSSTPILSCVLITAGEDRVTIHGQESAIELDQQIPAGEALRITRKGTVAIQADTLTRVLGVLPGGVVSMEEREDRGGRIIELRCGKSQYKLNGDDLAAYPPSAAPPEGTWFTTKVKALREAFVPSFSIAPDDNRYGLNGLYLNGLNGGLATAGTDGNRMRVAYTAIPEVTENKMPRRRLIPSKVINAFLRLATNADETVSVAVASSSISMIFGGTQIVGRLIEAEFPAYKEVLPKSHLWRFKVNRADLISAIQRTKIVLNSGTGSVGISLITSGDSLILQARGVDLGDAREEVTVSELTGKFERMGSNPAFLIEALQSFTKTEIILCGMGPLAPMLLSEEDEIQSPDGDRNLAVVMPLRLD
jgi:DNA polymerase-3 subunit beta